MLIPASNSIHLRRFRQLEARQKEPGTIDWIESTVGPSDVFFDVGANVGVYSVLATIVAPTARVFAFEPEPQTVAALQELVVINRLSITVFPIGLGARTRVTTWPVRGIAAGLSEPQFRDMGGRYIDGLRIGASIVSIDDLIASKVVPTPTHVKIDVDGTDFDVLCGLKKSITDRTLRWIAIEASDEREKRAACDFLAQHSFVPCKRFSSDIMQFFERQS